MDVEQELAQLRETVAALTAQVSTLTAGRPNTTPHTAIDTTEQRSTRRGALRLLGAATVGGVAALAMGQPASADNGISLLGAVNSTPNWTRCDFVSATPGGTAFMFQAGNSLAPATLGGYPAALGGVSTSSVSPTGVQAYTNQAAGVALHARHVSGNHAVLAQATSFGSGVVAESTFGSAVQGISVNRIGIQGSGGSYGGTFGGGVAAMRLAPSSFTGPPAPLLAHSTGELSVDNQGDLWFCSKGSVPERWHRLNQPGFYPITPTRVYDSRQALPAPGVLSTGQNRTISVKDARNVNGGAITVTDAIPDGVTAVAANITIAGTIDGGYLSVNPGGNAVITASTINWSQAGQVLANGVIVTLNTNRELTVICDGGGSTHFIVDITGYFL